MAKASKNEKDLEGEIGADLVSETAYNSRYNLGNKYNNISPFVAFLKF